MDDGPARIPQQLGAFLIEREVWNGLRSTVYLARDTRDNALVALKMLCPVPGCDQVTQRQNASLEAERLRALSHPSIVPLRKHGEIDHVPYLCFPYIDGLPLEEALRQGQLPSEALLDVMIQVCRAVHHAHTRNIIHRDLKPHNILVDKQRHPWVLDWGLSWRKGGRTEKGITSIVGTPAYMSPEQARGEEERLTAASDVYSLGAIFYHMLTGQPPFEGSTSWKTIQMAMSLPPHPPSKYANVDPRLERIALWAIEKEPRKRYADAQALADDLQRVRANGEPRGPGGLLGHLFRNC